MTRRKKPLKAPFVVTTFGAFGAIVACGGGVASIGNGTSGGDPSPTSTTNPTTPPGDVPCSAHPKEGDGCAKNGDQCGDVCTSAPGFYCNGRTWTVMAGSCNPPSNVCPGSAPAVGSSCFSGGASCSYPDACIDWPAGTSGSRQYQCLDGAWQMLPSGYVALCPPTLPSSTDSCAPCADSYPSECEYVPQDAYCPDTRTSCDPKTGRWTIITSSCNPPAVDAGK